MLRWLEHETDPQDQRLGNREKVRKKIQQIVKSSKDRIRLEAIARSRNLGIWRIKRAKIILNTIDGENVRRIVLNVRVPPESIIKCQDRFAQIGFAYFNKPERKPTAREVRVEKMLAFLENPPSKRSSKWQSTVVRYIGNDYVAKDIQQIRDLISDPDSSTTEIARQVCRRFNLQQANGKPQLTQTQHALRRMDMDNIIELPPRKNVRQNSRKRLVTAKLWETNFKPVRLKTAEIKNLQLIPVQSKADRQRWSTLISQFHYIKTTRLFGAQMRYLVYGDSHLSGTLNIAKRSPFESERYWASRYMQIKRGNILLGALGFASSAWRLTSRDRHINWTDEVRTANLKYVVNNVRFLILPWIHSKYLASRILGQIARQLPFDWEARYGYRPVLLETFVQTDRFKGTCYKAANWIKIGTTGGYSLSSVYKKDVPTKDIYIYPLRKNYREILSSRCSEPSNRIRTQG